MMMHMSGEEIVIFPDDWAKVSSRQGRRKHKEMMDRSDSCHGGAIVMRNECVDLTVSSYK